MSSPKPKQSDRPQGKFGRPALGLLVDRIDRSYQDEVMHELAAAARARDLDLFCFAGAMLGAQRDDSRQRNHIYDLASSHVLDALVVSSGSLESRIGTEQLATYLERFDPLPMCSLGVELPYTPSITIDNTSGMREAVFHLISVHGLERIAFVGGPEANEEAGQRYRGYLEALEEARLDPDPNLYVEGDFQQDSGAAAVRTLLDERHIGFDAVVAASDEMAVGAMAELDERGLHVPEAVAVVGFDDTVAGRYSNRPLTTVRQRIPAQAAEAVQVVLQRLRGQEVSRLTRLVTELVTRRSCGCTGRGGAPAIIPPESVARGEPRSLAGRRTEILIELIASAPELSGTKWADRLLDAFVAEMRGHKTVSFAGVVDELAEQLIDGGFDLGPLQPVLTSLRRVVAPALVQRPDLMIKSESLLHEARVLVANMMRHREVQRRLEVERMARAVTSLSRALITSVELQAVLDSVSKHLPRLGIPSGYVALYDHPTERRIQSVEDRLRVHLAHDQSRPTAIELPTDEYPAVQLVPRSLLPRDTARAYVIQPLGSGRRAHGLLVLELSNTSGAVYESLRAQVSAAIERVHLASSAASSQPPPVA